MVSVATLWAPILLSAVLVFVVSSVIHMLLGYHASDFGKVARQNDVLDALRGFNLSPGDYLLPRPASSADARSPEFKAVVAKGPVVLMRVMPGGMAMGKTWRCGSSTPSWSGCSRAMWPAWHSVRVRITGRCSA